MYEIDKVKFGEFVSALRKEKGITQKELAGRLFISDKAVSKWETGHSVPDITLLVPLAELLGVTVTELLECQRIENADKLDVEQADNLVKKVISLSEEEALGRPRIKKNHILIYVCCVLVSLMEMLVLYQLQERFDLLLSPAFMMVGMTMLFGVYFWFFMREKLPAYYDEHKINVYVDGVLHMNLPGVYFNNHNWPHIVKALRLWSTVGMVLFPIAYVVLSSLFSAGRPVSDVAILLFLELGGLFIPPCVLGRKYQQPDGEEPKAKKGLLVKSLAVVLALVLFGGVIFFGNGGAVNSVTRVGCVERAERNSWSARYMFLDGFMQRTMWTEEGEECFSVVVETEEGTIAIEIKDEEGNVLFDEEDIATGIYEVEASGKYTVRVVAEDHRGSFAIGD